MKKEELTEWTVSMDMIYSMHTALWEGKAQPEEGLCLGRGGVNAAKCL